MHSHQDLAIIHSLEQVCTRTITLARSRIHALVRLVLLLHEHTLTLDLKQSLDRPCARSSTHPRARADVSCTRLVEHKCSSARSLSNTDRHTITNARVHVRSLEHSQTLMHKRSSTIARSLELVWARTRLSVCTRSQTLFGSATWFVSLRLVLNSTAVHTEARRSLV